MLLSIDPGLRALGAALWGQTPLGWRLHEAELVVGARVGLDSVAWSAAAWSLMRWTAGATVTELVVEFPRVYPGGRGKGDPNDLLQLAAVVGALALEFRGALVTIVRPSEWKGNTPKHVTENRVRRALSPEEMARVKWPAPSLRHNVVDGIAIGLWKLKAQRSGSARAA